MENGARTGGSGRWWTPSTQGNYANRGRRVDVQEFQRDQRDEKARNLCSPTSVKIMEESDIRILNSIKSIP
jgi:hypothetical protein